METGGAQVGDRTLVDALKPASDVLRDKTRSVAEAAEHARRGCDSTKAMKFAKRGRSVHVRQEMLDGVVDPGAYAVSIILDAIAAIGADHEFD